MGLPSVCASACDRLPGPCACSGGGRLLVTEAAAAADVASAAHTQCKDDGGDRNVDSSNQHDSSGVGKHKIDHSHRHELCI